MPIVKDLKEMFAKYEAKYSGDNVRTALTAVKDIMDARYEQAQAVIYNAVERTRDILSEEGVPTGQWGGYMAFAQQLASKTFSHRGKTLQAEASALKAYFVTAYNLDPKILDRIIEAILGTVPPY